MEEKFKEVSAGKPILV